MILAYYFCCAVAHDRRAAFCNNRSGAVSYHKVIAWSFHSEKKPSLDSKRSIPSFATARHKYGDGLDKSATSTSFLPNALPISSTTLETVSDSFGSTAISISLSL